VQEASNTRGQRGKDAIVCRHEKRKEFSVELPASILSLRKKKKKSKINKKREEGRENS